MSINQVNRCSIRRISLSPTGYKLLKLIYNHWGYSLLFFKHIIKYKSEVSKDHKK